MSDSNESNAATTSKDWESVLQNLYVDLCNLIVESRVPGIDERGYGDGCHCPPLLGSNFHHCDLTQPQCQKNKILIHHLLRAVKRNEFEIEVIMLPDCCPGSNINEKIQNKDYLLLERWSMEFIDSETHLSIEIPQLLRAVRSFLHFSQISAWFSSTKGKSPSKIYYWIKQNTEAEETKFEQEPEVHSFPLCKISDDLYGSVEVKYPPRTQFIPTIPCSKHPALCEYSLRTIAENSDICKNILLNTCVAQQLKKTCDIQENNSMQTKTNRITDPVSFVVEPCLLLQNSTNNVPDGHISSRMFKYSKHHYGYVDSLKSVTNLSEGNEFEPLPEPKSALVCNISEKNICFEKLNIDMDLHSTNLKLSRLKNFSRLPNFGNVSSLKDYSNNMGYIPNSLSSLDYSNTHYTTSTLNACKNDLNAQDFKTKDKNSIKPIESNSCSKVTEQDILWYSDFVQSFPISSQKNFKLSSRKRKYDNLAASLDINSAIKKMCIPVNENLPEESNLNLDTNISLDNQHSIKMLNTYPRTKQKLAKFTFNNKSKDCVKDLKQYFKIKKSIKGKAAENANISVDSNKAFMQETISRHRQICQTETLTRKKPNEYNKCSNRKSKNKATLKDLGQFCDNCQISNLCCRKNCKNRKQIKHVHQKRLYNKLLTTIGNNSPNLLSNNINENCKTKIDIASLESSSELINQNAVNVDNLNLFDKSRQINRYYRLMHFKSAKKLTVRRICKTRVKNTNVSFKTPKPCKRSNYQSKNLVIDTISQQLLTPNLCDTSTHLIVDKDMYKGFRTIFENTKMKESGVCESSHNNSMEEKLATISSLFPSTESQIFQPNAKNCSETANKSAAKNLTDLQEKYYFPLKLETPYRCCYNDVPKEIPYQRNTSLGRSNFCASLYGTPKHNFEYFPSHRSKFPKAKRLLRNFEESILGGCFPAVNSVKGFNAEIGASGSFCPNHLTLPADVSFYELENSHQGSATYMAHVMLENTEYYLPKKGAVQVTLFNPSETVVKMFVLNYDLSNMPPSCHTFIRQKTYYLPVGNAEKRPLSQKWLRFIIHLRFASSKIGKIFLHKDIKIVVLNKSNDDAASELSLEPRELCSFLSVPMNPTFSNLLC